MLVSKWRRVSIHSSLYAVRGEHAIRAWRWKLGDWLPLRVVSPDDGPIVQPIERSGTCRQRSDTQDHIVKFIRRSSCLDSASITKKSTFQNLAVSCIVATCQSFRPTLAGYVTPMPMRVSWRALSILKTGLFLITLSTSLATHCPWSIATVPMSTMARRVSISSIKISTPSSPTTIWPVSTGTNVLCRQHRRQRRQPRTGTSVANCQC